MKQNAKKCAIGEQNVKLMSFGGEGGERIEKGYRERI